MHPTQPRYDLEIKLREQRADTRPVCQTAHDSWGAHVRHEYTGERYYRWAILYRGVDVGSIHATRHPGSGWVAEVTPHDDIDYLPTFYRQQLADFQEFLSINLHREY